MPNTCAQKVRDRIYVFVSWLYWRLSSIIKIKLKVPNIFLVIAWLLGMEYSSLCASPYVTYSTWFVKAGRAQTHHRWVQWDLAPYIFFFQAKPKAWHWPQSALGKCLWYWKSPGAEASTCASCHLMCREQYGRGADAGCLSSAWQRGWMLDRFWLWH